MPKQKPRSEKELTKKQLALSGRQRQQRKKLFIGLAALGGMILVVALVGVYDNLIARPATPVAVVNDVTLRLDQYQARLRYERFLLDALTRRIDAQMANVDTTDASNDFMVQYFQQVSAQVMQQRAGLPRQVVDDMVEEELARQKAAQVGLAVSEDEVNEALRTRMAQGLGYVTQTQATLIANTAVARTATAQLDTPTPLPTATPTIASTVAATEVATPTAETTPQPTPTLHVITDDEFGKEYADYLKALNEQARVSDGELRDYVRGGLFVTAVRKWFADQTPTEADQVQVSQIQAATDEQAKLAMDRLGKGEDFALVATQVSSNTLTAKNGGDMGWFMKGQLELRYSPEMEQAAFSLEPGTYSQPITTTVGWQIIKVNERGVRPLDESQLVTAQTESYANWLQESKKSAGVQVSWTSDMAPVDPALEQTGTQ
jgi:parvulin-like peptidyl-prolyl isomerase